MTATTERLAGGLYAVVVDGKSIGTVRRVRRGPDFTWRCERLDGTRIGWDDAPDVHSAARRVTADAEAVPA